MPLLFNVKEFTGSAPISFECLSLLVLALVVSVELEAEVTIPISLTLSPARTSGLNAGCLSILGPFTLVLLKLLLNLNPELESEEIALGTLGYFFVAGSRAFGMTVDLETETSAEVVPVLLFLRFWSTFDATEIALFVGNLKGEIGTLSRGVGVAFRVGVIF